MSGHFAVATSMPKGMDNYRRGNDINISDGHAAMGAIEVSGHGNINHNVASAEDLVSGISGSGSGGSFFNRGHGSYEQLEQQQLDQQMAMGNDDRVEVHSMEGAKG